MAIAPCDQGTATDVKVNLKRLKETERLHHKAWAKGWRFMLSEENVQHTI
jgi:hypothetical protein